MRVLKLTKKTVKRVRSRIFMITQYEFNPKTGEDLFFNETVIRKGLQIREESLQAWAYIRHDKDVYNQDDDIPEGKDIGDVRPPHWHVMLSFKNPVEISGLARDFGVSENYVERWQGQGAFLTGIQYLTHEHPRQYQDLGKHRYEREEVKFPSEKMAQHFWERLDDRTERLLNTLPKAELIEKMMKKINSGEYDLDDVYKKEPSLFNEQEALFKRARRNYLAKKPIPAVRSNYYITGNGGAGKSVSAKAMARSLFPSLPDEKIFFTVGDGRVAFDRYDGQPVIIWDDWRAKDLLSKFDRGTVWKIFAINPEKISIGVKYGEVNLTNTVNIVTSVQKFENFIDELAGEYVDRNRTRHKKEDKTQGYRRFPVFVEVTKAALDIYISLSLTDGEYKDYERAIRVEASMIEYAKNNTEDNLKKIAEPFIKVHKKVEKKHGAELKKEPKELNVKVEVADKFKNFFDDDDIIDGEFVEK
ncbi:MAG: Rep family protein [Streptococcus parasanguinis]|nr:Rep family protein [Streptococcus parasanguinis]